MTDRVNAIVLVLAQDVRDDDVRPLLEAVKQLRGVIDARLNISDVPTLIAEARAHQQWREKLAKLINERP